MAGRAVESVREKTTIANRIAATWDGRDRASYPCARRTWGKVQRRSIEGVAQPVERRTFNPQVVGSTPTALIEDEWIGKYGAGLGGAGVGRALNWARCRL